jgi:hypothetical protein
MGGRMASCLTILAASGLLGCIDAPTQQLEAVPALTVAASDSVALTYICGNMFRIRNASFEPRSVRWDIYNASPADTGSLWARGRDVGRTSVDFFVTARTKGTMRVFIGNRLISTKANGNKAACAAPVDTSVFSVAQIRNLSAFRNAPTIVDGDTNEVWRTLVDVYFLGSASSSIRRDFQRTFGLQLVGVYSTSHLFRVPDSGPSLATFSAQIAALRAHPAISQVRTRRVLGPAKTDGARYPTDGSNAARNDYLARNPRVWAATALRLPQAWWCENGRYGATPPRIAFFEHNLPGALSADLSNSLVQPMFRYTVWRDSLAKPIPDTDGAYLREHGHWVAGMISAQGDNGVGSAGPLWQSDLRVFTLGNVNTQSSAGPVQFYQGVLPAIIAAAPRVLSISSDFGPYTDTLALKLNVEDMTTVLHQPLTALPNLLLIKSAGNDSINGSFSAASISKRAAINEALVSLRDTVAAMKSRILFVGATDSSGARWIGSNDLPSVVELYAPGVDVMSIDSSGSTVAITGTSFAAPLVAGVAGQLIAMDSSLSAADIKSLLLDGARDSLESSGGGSGAPSRVNGASNIVFEADAFGSLRLLSSRAGTPLCGATVLALRKQITPNPIGNAPLEVSINRYGGGLVETIDRDENSDRMYNDRSGNLLSVAPGGRTITLSSVIPNQSTATNLFRLTASGWTAQPKRVDTFAILFGERDTAFVQPDGVVFGTATGRTPPMSLGFTFPQGEFPSSYAFAPDGSAISVVSGQPAPNGTIPKGIHIIRRNGSRDSLTANVADLTVAHRTAWLPDSRGVVMSIATSISPGPGVRFYESQLFHYAVSGTGITEVARSTVLSDPLQVPQSLVVSPEGQRLQLIVGDERDLGVNTDCSLRSLGLQGLSGLRTDLVLAPIPCPSMQPPPPGGGGGGMDGRILRLPAATIAADTASAARRARPRISDRIRSALR